MNLSQAEIDALMGGGSAESEAAAVSESESILAEYQSSLAPADGGLTEIEIDTLGEVGNMCMGSSATTMYTLLDRRVEITTPRVQVLTTNDVLSMYQVPFVIVEIEYTEGIHGKNLLLLKEYDAALITDVLMGGEGVVEEPIELGELHMSAINEVMNQMMGASATALSQLLEGPVNISTPVSRHMVLQSGASEVLEDGDDPVIVINFDMEIEDLLKSQLVQIMSYEQGRAMSAMLTSKQEASLAAEALPGTVSAPEPEPAPAPAPPPAAPAPAPAPAAPAPAQAAQFESFAPLPMAPAPSGTLNLVYDIPLQVSVQLGKTKKEISEILEFDMGTVVVLEKTAGEPVEILVNGKHVASGEVVVIDENYGVRITQLHGSL